MAANLVATRGNRCSASILGWIEENLYKEFDIDTKMQRRLRQQILDQVNSFKDLSMDIVKSENAVVNEIWVQKLDEIHEQIKALNGAA
jgi:C4-type Zn-finger protein